MKNAFRDWSNVRYFLAVFREGSTLAASRKLGAAQPTVARRIDALERELGLVLFERETRGFRPTALARALLPQAEAIEKAAEGFEEKAADLTRSRPIRITAPGANFSPRMQRIIYDFTVANPGVGFEFIQTTKVLDLAAGEADVALRLTTKAPEPDLICRKISVARYAVYGSRAYAAKRRLPMSEADLKGHRFVVYRPDPTPRPNEAWLLQFITPDQIVGAFAEFALMREAVTNGQGLGLLNVKHSEPDDNLIRCFDPVEALTQDHLLLVSPEAYRRPEVKKFIKFFAPRYASIFK
ncbi:LysR family transcriptional regulator [Defluviimonas aestuarii]|nr:LysR family transcriptional regulator [Defluviimonas aestuarii]